MFLRCEYTREDLQVDFYPKLLSRALSDGWYDYLQVLFQNIFKSTRRSSILVGDDGMVYKVQFGDYLRENVAIPWDDIPAMRSLKELIERVTGEHYTVCIIQCYPKGSVGINPHRDKEMVEGTCICGLSIGSARTIQFTHARLHGSILPHLQPLHLKLPSGSMYVMRGKTNQRWLHSIPKDDTDAPRYSFTFRNYKC